ncbi:MAG: DUF488 domain-containing protein [Alphaproteobacteria bacterium]|nr:DUF488 domain-containing protein [Alphaproteobacteria bacterium]MBV9979061.1 DUF488 domain-containing protein [Bradyrhizobium sp.]
MEGPLRKRRPFVLVDDPLVTILYSIGHSNRSLEAFVALLHANNTEELVDIRAFTRSRANPQFNAGTFAPALAGQDIGYTHIPALGGRRSSKRQDSPNGLWENAAFRAYADYALTEPFEEGIVRLLDIGSDRSTAMMCSEAVWWRCHRRIIADYLLARGHTVLHIVSSAAPKPATLTPGAIIHEDKRITYPPVQQTLV